jgi:hypothetical protein
MMFNNKGGGVYRLPFFYCHFSFYLFHFTKSKSMNLFDSVTSLFSSKPIPDSNYWTSSTASGSTSRKRDDDSTVVAVVAVAAALLLCKKKCCRPASTGQGPTPPSGGLKGWNPLKSLSKGI